MFWSILSPISLQIRFLILIGGYNSFFIRYIAEDILKCLSAGLQLPLNILSNQAVQWIVEAALLTCKAHLTQYSCDDNLFIAPLQIVQ